MKIFLIVSAVAFVVLLIVGARQDNAEREKLMSQRKFDLYDKVCYIDDPKLIGRVISIQRHYLRSCKYLVYKVQWAQPIIKSHGIILPVLKTHSTTTDWRRKWELKPI